MTQFDVKALQSKFAIDKGESSINNAIETLERALRELNKYREDYASNPEPSKKANVLNWTINELVSNIMPNLRIDLLADAQAELTRLQPHD